MTVNSYGFDSRRLQAEKNPVAPPRCHGVFFYGRGREGQPDELATPVLSAALQPRRVTPRMRALIAAVVLALGLPVLAQEAKPLEPGREALAIPHEKYKLKNGLEVILSVDRKLPIVAVNVWYHVGAYHETPGRTGFAHLFEHMMFQGSKNVADDVHISMLEQLGATDLNGTTNFDRTNYFETVPSNHLETALWLESDRMGFLLDALTEEKLRT